MGEYSIQNDEICIMVNSFGAELKSLQDVKEKREYMWQADPAYWNRTSPILFPFVGGLKDKTYRHQGVSYSMNQHGFARDMEFQLTEQTEQSLRFTLCSTEETLKKYPFAFELELGYEITGRELVVSWTVRNPGEETMYFAIGGHPAFICPPREGVKQTECEIYYGTDSITSTIISSAGLVTGEKMVYDLKDGAMLITENLFDHDALVIEGNQTQKVALLDDRQMPYLSMTFDAPLFGIWSPPHKKAPFICIEPWYGRCDGESFDGNLAEREWENALVPGEVFTASYRIVI